MFYENFFNSVKPDMYYIPESATFQDAAAFAGRAIQDAYTEAVLSISSREMAIFESTMYGKEVSYVTEASGFLETIKNFFHTIWEKIKGFFGKIYTMIKQLFARISIAGGKVTESDFTKAVDKLKDDFKVKGVFDFKKAGDNVTDMVVAIGKSTLGIQDNIDSIGAEDPEKDLKDFNAEAEQQISTFKDEFRYFFEDWKDNLGTVTKADINSNKETINGFVFKENNWTKNINKEYKDCKRALDKSMNDLKATLNKSKDEQDVAKQLRCQMSAVRTMSSALTKTVNMFNIGYKKVRSNYMSLVAKVLARTGVKGTAESVELDYFMEKDEPEDTDEIGDFVEEV